ncbi:MAG: hypothetical protein ACTSVU_07325, partial [Promethearchaeota archaeon]
ISISLEKILNYVGFSNRRYLRCLRAIKEIDPGYCKCSIGAFNEQVNSIICRITSRFLLRTEILNLSMKFAKENQYRLGNKPEIIAGTAVALMLEIHPGRQIVSKNQISRELGVSTSTIYTNVKKLLT